MSDKIHSSAESHELQLKMSVPQSHEYGRNLSQDIQLQVIIKENESAGSRTKAKASPASMKKPVTRAQDFPPGGGGSGGGGADSTIIKGQYGKLNLNQSSRDFRVEQQMNNENPYGYAPQMVHHPPMTFPSSDEKADRKTKCLDSIYFSEALSSLISEKLSERSWKYFKWPLLLFVLCIFLGLITLACVNSKNANHLKPNCINVNVNSSCLLEATESNKSNINDSVNAENLPEPYSQTDTTFQVEEIEAITEPVLVGSTTLLRPVIAPQLLQSDFGDKNYLEKGSRNGYTIIERKPSQRHKETITTERIQRPYGQESVGKDKRNKTEDMNGVAFTSGHQNNFGIPIEEDERILRLLNEELIKLENQTEHSNVVGQTENSLIVSPTVPVIQHNVHEAVTPSSKPSDEIQCQSTSLLMCRGVLQYDLTSSNAQSLYLSISEQETFENLISSNCSARAVEFICSSLEPECRPTQIGILQPCKRICKSILEACSSLIASSDILTYTFDCDKYPDSDDRNVCEDPTRRSDCFENEFECQDLACIPSQWQCDNIKDCNDGGDELGCLVCSPEEFRCRSNEKCLSDEQRCDTNEDCNDGSDEQDCFSDDDSEDPQMYPRIFSFASFLLPNYTGENTFTAIADEDRLAAGSELNESLASAVVSNIVKGVTTLEELKSHTVNISRNLGLANEANFQDSKEIMMTSDSENKLKISHTSNMTEFESKRNESKSEATPSPSCSGNELRCVSGKCITVDQLCDKVMDCPDGEDELMCTYEERPKPTLKKP